MNLNRDDIKKIKELILFTIFVLVLLWNYKMVFSVIGFLVHIISPFVLGAAIAFVLNVPMQFIERNVFCKGKLKEKKWAKKIARPVSFLATLVFVVGIIGLVLFVVFPELANTIVRLGKSLQAFIPQVQEWAIEMFEHNPEIVQAIAEIELKWDQVLGNALDFFQKGAGNVLDSTYAAAKSIVNGLYNFFIAFVFSCYVLLQKEKLSVQVRKILYAFLPRDWTEILLALGSVTHKTFTHFLTGQCTEAIILGGIFLVAMNIFRLPYALLISILLAFTALIPVFGGFIGCFIGAVLIFMESPIQALIFVIMFFVIQQIEGNLIYPHVVGNSVGLPSMWVLVAVTLGASTMGVVGMLIFIPITSVIYTIFKGIVNRRLQEKGIQVKLQKESEKK